MRNFYLMVATAGLLIASAATAQAQSAQCSAWRSELAGLSRSGSRGDPRAARQAQRVSAELSQLSSQFRAMGCDRQRVLFFGSDPPPQCGGIGARIGQLQANLGALQQRAEGNGPANARRQAQLAAAIEANCRPGVYQAGPAPAPAAPPRQRSFFEALFGLPEEPPAASVPQGMPELDRPLERREPARPRWGAGRPVCVRACDGYFFPLPTSAGGRDGAEELCQALCPASETKLFYIGGSGDIESAAGEESSYSELPNAGRYLKSFDPSCGCRRNGESWAKTLADAEELLARRKGDVIVTPAKAEELSRPRIQRGKEARDKNRKVPINAGAGVEEDATAAITPTSGKESSGIGPQAIDGAQVVGTEQGQTRRVTTEAGDTRTVRIVAPALTPQDGGNRPAGEVRRTP